LQNGDLESFTNVYDWPFKKSIRIMSVWSWLLIIASIVISSQLMYSNPMVNAVNQIDRYWSGLTGDRQIPPVNTDARGYVGLKFDDDLGVFVFTVNAENIGNVTGI
jgi:hypothetical protein